MDYVIAIPTYKRSQTISSKTLKTLKEGNIDSSLIYLFVANDDEEKAYLDSVDSSLYNKIVVGVLGLKNQRNFISDYFNEKQCIVQIDDDIEEIAQMIEGENEGNTKKDRQLNKVVLLDQFFRDAFERLLDQRAYLWGVYPVYNSFFMNKKITDDLRFCVGCLFGIINRKCEKLQISIDEKEDFERTILNYAIDSCLIRYNDITIKTKFYKTPGGMQAEDKDRKLEAMKSAENLVERYPMYCKLWLGKKSKHPEVKLINATPMKHQETNTIDYT